MNKLVITEGQTFRHYKGNFYKILHVAKMESTEIPVVVYSSEEHPSLVWVRQRDDFLDVLEDGRLRFQLVDSIPPTPKTDCPF